MIIESTGSSRQEEMAETISEENAEHEERASTSFSTNFSASTSSSLEPATEGLSFEVTIPQCIHFFCIFSKFKTSGMLIISQIIIINCHIKKYLFEELLLSIIFVFTEWKIESDLVSAAQMYRQLIIKDADDKPDLVISLDLHNCEMDREREIFAFYKRPNVDCKYLLIVQLKGLYLYLYFEDHLVVCNLLKTGDVALGDGVKQHFFTLILEKLHHGFELDFGKF